MKQPKPDYTLSLNKGLFNSFADKYCRKMFDDIKDIVNDREEIPTKEFELVKWVTEVVDTVVDNKFKGALIEQIIKSIKAAKL